jgi:hypothetical protein
MCQRSLILRGGHAPGEADKLRSFRSLCARPVPKNAEGSIKQGIYDLLRERAEAKRRLGKDVSRPAEEE